MYKYMEKGGLNCLESRYLQTVIYVTAALHAGRSRVRFPLVA